LGTQQIRNLLPFAVRRSKQRTTNNIIAVRFGAQRMAKNTGPNLLSVRGKLKT
jgi:hypothetical protein